MDTRPDGLCSSRGVWNPSLPLAASSSSSLSLPELARRDRPPRSLPLPSAPLCSADSAAVASACAAAARASPSASPPPADTKCANPPSTPPSAPLTPAPPMPPARPAAPSRQRKRLNEADALEVSRAKNPLIRPPPAPVPLPLADVLPSSPSPASGCNASGVALPLGPPDPGATLLPDAAAPLAPVLTGDDGAAGECPRSIDGDPRALLPLPPAPPPMLPPPGDEPLSPDTLPGLPATAERRAPLPPMACFPKDPASSATSAMTCAVDGCHALALLEPPPLPAAAAACAAAVAATVTGAPPSVPARLRPPATVPAPAPPRAMPLRPRPNPMAARRSPAAPCTLPAPPAAGCGTGRLHWLALPKDAAMVVGFRPNLA